MQKYPGLSAVAGIMTFIGWAAAILGALMILGGAIETVGARTGGLSIAGSFWFVLGTQSALGGLLLAAAGGIAQVLMDVEGHLSILAARPGSSNPPRLADGEKASVGTAATSDVSEIIARPVPGGMVEVRRTRLAAGVSVFSVRHGDGVVIGPARDRFFVRVQFQGEAAPIEVESYGLFYRAA